MCWIFTGIIAALLLSCSNRALVPGFVLLLISQSEEEEEEMKAGSRCAAEREREGRRERETSPITEPASTHDRHHVTSCLLSQRA